MIACRTASLVAFGALYAAGAFVACREPAAPEVPPVTVAYPRPLEGSGAGELDAALDPSKLDVAFVEDLPPKQAAPWTRGIVTPPCSRLFLVVVKGTLTLDGETLSAGDVQIIHYPRAAKDLKGTGSVVRIIEEFSCDIVARPDETKTTVHAKDVPELRWANGGMRAHLDVGSKISPDVYVGRLEGTAGVAEHEHATSVETLIAIEASGTFTIDGKDGRLGPKQIVTVPKGTKHAWKPDPGTKLVAIQLYSPPGPEQRFIGLAAAAAQDAGADAGKSRADCDPPFSFNDAGHRHYKERCL